MATLSLLRLSSITIVTLFLAVPLQAVSGNGADAPPEVDSATYEDRMRIYLQTEYSRPDQVDEDHLQITSISSGNVGDVSLVVVEAGINGEGKEARAYFDATTLRFIGEHLPTYQQATGGKLGYDATLAVMSGGTEVIDALVSFLPPPDYRRADDVYDPATVDLPIAAQMSSEVAQLAEKARTIGLSEEERERYAIEVNHALPVHNARVLARQLGALAEDLRAYDGLARVEVPPSPIAAELQVKAAPAALVALAARSDVLSVDVNHYDTVTASIDLTRQVSGAKASNDLGYWGSGRAIASMDTGASSVTISGLNMLPWAERRSFAPTETNVSDNHWLGHGTPIGWVLRGGKASDGTLTASHWGLARDSNFYSAKMSDSDGSVTEAKYGEALSHITGTWTADLITTSLGVNTRDGGTHWMSLRFDHAIHSMNRAATVASGNSGYIAIPAGAYNVVSVGAYDDRGTADRGDDTLYSGTSLEKTPDGRKKPDLVMPGVNVALPTKNGNSAFADQTGTSIAAPHAAAGMALYPDSWTGRDRKCALLSSSGRDGWGAGWGWGKPWIENGRTPNYRYTGSITQGQNYDTPSFTIGAGKYVSAYLVWWREMSGPTTPGRDLSDLDLRLIDANTKVYLDTSNSIVDNVEGFVYKNTGTTSKSVQLRVTGYDVEGSSGQWYTVCYDIRS